MAKTCPSCAGSGECASCDGSGNARTVPNRYTADTEIGKPSDPARRGDCTKCNGTGSCQECKGSGEV